ncbi:MAG: hypothetical protein HQL03_14955, partial [Nitrospirae bacterium]|nr:hypothetical protein [Nitrospirota bacterium]
MLYPCYFKLYLFCLLLDLVTALFFLILSFFSVNLCFSVLIQRLLLGYTNDVAADIASEFEYSISPPSDPFKVVARLKAVDLGSYRD